MMVKGDQQQIRDESKNDSMKAKVKLRRKSEARMSLINASLAEHIDVLTLERTNICLTRQQGWRR